MSQGRITLTRYLSGHGHGPCGDGAGGQSSGPDPGREIGGLLQAVATAVKVISGQTSRGALVGALGSAEAENVQGEVQKRLDVISNEVMIAETEWTGHLAAMVSEEMPDVRPIPARYPRGRHLLVFDPLDGSSNIDVNISVGSIFSVLRAPAADAPPAAQDFLQPGTAQVAAGFALYGPATMLILTLGRGVDGFTLDRDLGEFVLTHPGMRMPAASREFAINASNERHWEPPVARYVSECVAGRSGPRQADFNMRWIASLVAETFRILTRGGVFLYPWDSREPSRPGRLRLLYECNPIAFIVEQAGGAASTGRARVLDIEPAGLHQRVPFVFGSADEVARIEDYHAQHDAAGGERQTAPGPRGAGAGAAES